MAAGTRKATSATVGASAQTASSERRAPGKGADAKSERLNLRVTAEQKRAIERAAALAGQSLTDFVLSTIARQSRRVIRDWEVIRLADRDRDLFLAALDRTDARPLHGMRRADARHKKALG
jgi:uncharacterized protein (DUF1778 family)